MTSTSLEFEINHEGRNFLVAYESEGPLRNLLMSIQFLGLPVDTGMLQPLYESICTAMKHNAASYWREQEPKSSYGNVIGGHFFNALNSQL